MHVLMKLGISAFIVLIAIELAKAAIAELGELVHFNCHQDLCELTHEPLIGQLRTLKFTKADLVRSEVRLDQIVLVTKSGEVFLSKSENMNKQLLVQREGIEQFIHNPEVKALSMRTHRPGVLWVVLSGIVGGAIATIYWIQN
jgi:hypothetical protein